MPDDLTGDGAAAPARAVSALLFLTAGMTTLDAYSTLNSSPWTAENFGGDAAKVASLKEYVQHAVVFSMGYAAASAYLARNWFPILGAGVANAYLWWLYDRAAGRGESAGSVGWQSQR